MDEEQSEYLRRRVEEIEARVFLLVNEELKGASHQDGILLVEEIVGVQLGRILAAQMLSGGEAASNAAIDRITWFARGIAADLVVKRLRPES
jgi:hypothetical protein